MDIISKSVKVGLVFVIFAMLYTLFNVWWAGTLDVYPLLVGVYLMTFISVMPYVFINIVSALKNRNDGRWLIMLGLSLALLFSLSAALSKLVSLRAIIMPFAIYQLRYDSTLALSLALLGLSALVYMGSIMPEGRRLAKIVYFSIVSRGEEEVEVV